MDVQLGDPTLNALEIWGAEYQESNALLLRPSDRDFLSCVSARERCPVCFVGTITGDRRVSWPGESAADAVGGLELPGPRKEMNTGEPWGTACRLWGWGSGWLNRRSQMGWKEHFCPAFQKSSLPAGGHSLSPPGWCPSGLQIVLVDDREWPMGTGGQVDAPPTPPPTPVDLDLDWVLGKMPRKVRGGRRRLPSLARPHPLPHTCLVTCMPSTPPQCSHPCCCLCHRSSSSRGVSPCCSL